jgi:ketosteroid isomerase-like protein
MNRIFRSYLENNSLRSPRFLCALGGLILPRKFNRKERKVSRKGRQKIFEIASNQLNRNFAALSKCGSPHAVRAHKHAYRVRASTLSRKTFGHVLGAFFTLLFSISAFAQSDLQKIYDAEKAFERAAAEKGMNQAFVEFAAPDGVCFFPGFPVNCREYFKAQPVSGAALLWNPTFVDVSANGALGYTTGNSIYKPKGKDDANAFYGQYVSVWQRQPDGKYLAVLDTGISHAKPAKIETEWTSPADSGKELNEKKSSAADAAVAFFETAKTEGLAKAYRQFLADDARVLREGKFPLIGKKAALDELKKDKSNVSFTKRSTFSGAADLAYTTNGYALADKNGKEIEKGNFVQIWKLRGGSWQIVLDIFTPAQK